jgi:capsule polysaccharide export protein KpsE/RkpR
METTSKEKAEKSPLETVFRMIGLLLHWKWLIIGITVLGTLCVTGYCLISVMLPPAKSPMPNLYSAKATLLIQQTSQTDISGSILSALGISQGDSRGISTFDNGELVLQLLGSRSLVDRLIAEFNIAQRYGIRNAVKEKMRDLVLSHFSFSYTRTSGLLTISYQDIDPVFSRDIVNRIVELLDEWYSMNRGAAKQKQKEILGQKIDEVKQEVDSLQNKLKDLQKRYGVLTAQDLGATQTASVANLQSQLVLKEIEIKNYSSFSKVNDPRLEQLNAERQNLLDLIAQSKSNVMNANSDFISQQSLPDVAQQFSKLTMELDIQQRIYNTLSPQYEAAKLAPESEPIFSVFETAEVPGIKSGPSRGKYVVMGFAASLAAGIALVLGMNLLKGIFNDPEKMKYFKILK